MKRWQMVSIAVAVGLLIGWCGSARAELPQIAAARTAQERQSALVYVFPPQQTSVCPLERNALFAQGFCSAVYTVAPHSTILVIASLDSTTPLVPVPLVTLGNPMSTVETGNPYVQGSVTWSAVWFWGPESIVVMTALTNVSDQEQSGAAVIRTLFMLPKTTTPAGATAGVE